MSGLRQRLKLRMERLRVMTRGVPLECQPWGTPSELAERPSPFASLRFDVGTHEALLCYSRPAVAGRDVFGELVPYGELWRMGANEPTTIHLPFASSIGGVRVPRGRYALYSVPGESDWQIVVNRFWWQWGSTRDEHGAKGNFFTSAYTPVVASGEVGRAPLTAQEGPFVERLTYRAERVDESRTDVVLEWENVRLPIPITTG